MGDGSPHAGPVDAVALAAVYEELTEAARYSTGPAPDGGWDADAVVAHVIATTRMLAAASAELLAGRVPVVDNRPTHSPHYLAAIVKAARDREHLVEILSLAGRELVVLAVQLDTVQASTSAPTIMVDAGCIKVQSPVPFGRLLTATHLREHLGQLLRMAPKDGSQREGAGR